MSVRVVSLPATRSVEHEHVDVVVRHRLAVDGAVGQHRHEVVLRLRVAGLTIASMYTNSSAARARASSVKSLAASIMASDQRRKSARSDRGHADELGDHHQRQRHGEGLDGVDDLAGRQLVEAARRRCRARGPRGRPPAAR